MKINKKILAGLTAVSMLTCGIWMESVFAADTFSAEENTISWSLDESGVLEIAGQGAMNEWQNEEEVPWNGYRDQITEVRIKEGITSIGAYAFADCEKLVKLDIADSVQTIGAFAYFNCSGLSTLTIG